MGLEISQETMLAPNADNGANTSYTAITKPPKKSRDGDCKYKTVMCRCGPLLFCTHMCVFVCVHW